MHEIFGYLILILSDLFYSIFLLLYYTKKYD